MEGNIEHGDARPAMIADGALDGKEQSVERLSARLSVGERQLRRLFVEHLGTLPVSVAQTGRVLIAKQLIHDTTLPMTEVALAAGFSGLRRFNEVFQSSICGQKIWTN